MKLGIVGGGQLGRMIALAAHPLGIDVRVLEPKSPSSAGAVAQQITAAYDDADGLQRFADGLDVATYEFENVPAAAAEWLAARIPLRPGVRALREAQDRLREKSHFQDSIVPTAPFATADSAEQLATALERVGLPAVAKTRRFGYDGKGQRVLRSADDATPVWRELGERPLIVEGFVSFDRELSIICARGVDGSTVFYPLVENHHEDGILRRTISPAPGVDPAMQEEAEEYARRLLESLDYVGVLAVELFDVRGALLANEMAPRVHNSGHFSIEGSRTDQFENHVRAVCGMPLGDASPSGCAVMINLIGAAPPVADMLAVADAAVHLYDKEPRPRRKIGHVTVVAQDAAEAMRRAQQLEQLAREAERLIGR